MYSFQVLKVCFIGIGSIATKHIKNLHEICNEYQIKLTVDALRRYNSAMVDNEIMEIIDKVYTSILEMPSDYDAIFITNPTEFHIATLKQVHMKSKHFFIEKPIVSVNKAEEAAKFIEDKNNLYYVACPMRYKKVLQYIKKNISPTDVVGARCCCSSYLPDWRPNIDYRTCYSANKDLGGGVSIDLIHEWDYLVYLFGYPKRVACSITKKSDLEINCEDYAAYIAEYDDKMIEVHLDYYGRSELREIMLFLKEDTLVGDFINNSIKYLKEGKTIYLPEENNYNKKQELIHFFDLINGYTTNDNDIKTAYRTLMLTQGIIK